MNSFLPNASQRSMRLRGILAIGPAALLIIAFSSPLIVATVFASPIAPLAPAPVQDEGLLGDWVKMKPTGAGASFEMPSQPRYVERVFSPIQNEPPIKVRLHLTTAADGNLTYVFSYHDLHAVPKDRKTINDALDGAVRGSVANVYGQLVDAKELGLTTNPIAINHEKKYPGRQFVCIFAQNEKRYLVVAQVFLVGKRLYQLNCVMSQEVYDANLAAKFLKSFKVIAIEDDSPPRPKTTD